MKSFRFKQAGSMLIEALVALVVVGVGTFGVVKLNSVMLSGTGLSKTRTEAVEIALKRMEDLRNYALDVGCPGAGDSTETDPVSGTNASYVVGISITNKTAEMMNVDVCVAWDGSTTPCTAAADKRIILKSTVSCLGVGASGMLAGNATSQTGGKLKTPTGAARVGGHDQTPGTGELNFIGVGDAKIADGTRTYVDSSSGATILLDQNGHALLTIENPLDGGFSTISGRVYIEADNSGDPIVDPQGSTTAESDDTVFVLSSDASYCARVFPTLPVPSSGTKYHYFDYNCYVSKGWWGNIGVVRLDNPNDNNRVCLGDMAVDSAETSIWSRKANLSISRGYRAYKIINPDLDQTDPTNFKTVGIGFALQDDGTVSSDYEEVNLGASRADSHHDFLVTVINGQGTCEGSGNMKLVSGDSDNNNQFTGNFGRFYCMSGQCPDLAFSNTTQTTVVSGTITKATGAVLTGVDPADCQTTPTFTDNGGTYSYSCTKTWTGFAGSSWQGGISFLTPASPDTGNTTTVCSNDSGSSPTVLPSGYNVASTVNNKSAIVNPNSISFTDVALGVTSITIDFKAAAATSDCPLGTPATSWSPNSNASSTMKPLTWDPISLATSYLVKTCTLSGNATICTPGTSAGSETSPSYTPVADAITAGVKGICVSVTAHNGVNTDSIPSSTKCVTKSGNSYNFN